MGDRWAVRHSVQRLSRAAGTDQSGNPGIDRRPCPFCRARRAHRFRSYPAAWRPRLPDSPVPFAPVEPEDGRVWRIAGESHAVPARDVPGNACRSEEHTFTTLSLMRISYAVLVW